MQIADLLQRAKALGRAHASDETAESSAWGGSFADVFASAQQIVSNFVMKVVDWITEQDADELADEDIHAQVDALAETVGDTEVASAIEQAVLDELQSQGATQLVWYVSGENTCAICLNNATASPIPIGSSFPSGDKRPPLHPHCDCSVGVPGTGF